MHFVKSVNTTLGQVRPSHALEKDVTPNPRVRGENPGVGVVARAATERHLIAMTHDAALAAALQGLAGGGLPVRLIDDLRKLADELLQHESAVVLLDAQALGVPADAAVDAVNSQFPDVRLLVAGHATDQNLLAGRIADQKVFRFVHKPASTQRLTLLVEAAMQGTSTTVQVPRLVLPAGATQPPGGSPSSSLLPIIAGAAGVLALAVGGWLLMRKDETVAPPAVAQAADPPAIAGLLARADAALADERFVASDGSSAAELYREALRLSADHPLASRGFGDAIERALGGAEQALLAGQLEQARDIAEQVRLIEPDNSRLAFLNTQVERELARVNADATQREALQARQAQIRTAVGAVEEHVARGALLEPAGNNAVTSFRAAEAVGGGDPLVRSTRDSLVGALLTAADRELSADRPAAAQRLVEAAGTVNSSAPGLDFARRRIDEALIQQAAMSTAAAAPAKATAAVIATPAPTPAPAVVPASITSAPAARPDNTNAPLRPAAVPAAPTVVSANELRTLRRAAPDYPRLALQDLVSGWVEMEFTVTKDGSVRDVEVTASEPERIFDNAAMAAMRRYRYEPVLRDGAAVEQRARLRMRFTATDTRQ